MADYLIHYNKNHSKVNGQFVSGDGDGDGQVNDSQYNKDGHKKGVYSAKIDNYKKGNAFRDPYYIDKQGKKRSYQSYKEMPVEVQNAERARAKGKQFAKKAGSIALGVVGTATVALGATMLAKEIGKKTNKAFTDEQLEAMGIHVIKLNYI